MDNLFRMETIMLSNDLFTNLAFYFKFFHFLTIFVFGGLASLCLCLSLFCPGLFSAATHFENVIFTAPIL